MSIFDIQVLNRIFCTSPLMTSYKISEATGFSKTVGVIYKFSVTERDGATIGKVSSLFCETYPDPRQDDIVII